MDPESAPFGDLLDYLARTRGFDFGTYKRPSLLRRVLKRMDALSITGFSEYTDYLEVHPDEFEKLFNVILINVTRFFRDEPVWEYLRDQVLPPLLAGRPAASPLRVWSAGCASGEEAYSMAMLLAEALGRDQYLERVKIYATDVDEHALTEARHASYSEKQVQSIPPPLLDRYFNRDADRFTFDKDLRRSVVFGRHDLHQDAPISRVDILMCRNTMMYFNTEAQSRILTRFHFALVPQGVLLLGKAEMLLTHSRLFAPVDLRCRIFRKISSGHWHDRNKNMNDDATDLDSGQPDEHEALFSHAFDAGPQAQFIIDRTGLLAMFNDRARTLFGITSADRGRPIQDLELSYRPVELRSRIEQALQQRRAMSLKEIEWTGAGREQRFFDVSIVPLLDGAGTPLGASISFTDVSRAQELQSQLNRSKQDLETAYEELQSTNEELETTNEELQSTVEELETTNEELQSTNEELETMNEELQSTNEELQTMNQELRDRGDELNHANSLLQSILTGVRSGVIVLDRELHVIAWNHRAEDLWGLRTEEVKGQNFLNLDIGLPADQLRSGIRACLSGDSDYTETVVPATNRRGRAITCKVIGTPLMGPAKEARGVILLMDEEPAASKPN
jgi:two-component system CheB/CheR fusion protein